MTDPRPLVLHVVYRFAVGGLENGVVNLINRMPRSRWRHGVIALTEVSDAFRARIDRDDIVFRSLRKPPGHGIQVYPQLYRTFRELRPAIVHTRNLAALEAVVPAWFAGVPVRIHGEHGRDVGDLDGSNRRYQWVRRVYRPFVHQYVALSRDLERYLVERIGVPAARVEHVYNGVDSERFHVGRGRTPAAGTPFDDAQHFVVGTVGRFEAVKGQANLVHAFLRARELSPEGARRLRLVLVGDGPLRGKLEQAVRDGSAQEHVWFAGERRDVPELMRSLDCFVLSSLAEGISNTLLEAMACGLPSVATRVGANADLMEEGRCGHLVPAADPEALAHALLSYLRDPATARRHGEEARRIVERRFSLARMVADYEQIYVRLLRARGRPTPAEPTEAPLRGTGAQGGHPGTSKESVA